MKIEYIRARNFLCFGKEQIELDFTSFGKIVLINGKNLDYEATSEFDDLITDSYHTNSTGKSSVAEVLVYGLYGETIRQHVTHTQAIHNKTKKKLEVEVIFKMNDSRYRIVRTRQPDTLRLWQDGPPWVDQGEDNSNEQTLGGQPATQERIGEILGMNHKAFVNVVYFGQHNDYNFLECTAADQRQIAESLLSLEDFKDYCKQAKDDTKELKTEIKELIAVYQQICSSETTIGIRIKQIKQKKVEWENTCRRDIESLKQKQKTIEDQLATTDVGQELLKYEKAQLEIVELRDSVPKKNETETTLEQALDQAKSGSDKIREKLHELTLSFKSAKQDLVDRIKERTNDEEGLQKLEKLPQGAQCPHCYGVIDKQHCKHVMQLHKNRIESAVPKINAIQAKIMQLEVDIKKTQESQAKIDALKNSASSKLRKLAEELSRIKSRINDLLKIQRPELSCNEMVLKERISQIEHTLADKQKEFNNGGPYVEILAASELDLIETQEKKKDRRAKLDELDGLLPYYEWWVNGFDDIRSFIIERITPTLNARIAMWLDRLIGGKVKVTFDKHLNAKIESSDGDPYTYFAMCGSEKRRINLAISQAFSYIMMWSSGTWPNVVFLDEVSDSICQRGVYDVYKMICELSNEKQVFIITHNVDLRKMLDGVDTITMVRENGASRLENK